MSRVMNCIGGLQTWASLPSTCLETSKEQCTNTESGCAITAHCRESASDCDSSTLLEDFIFCSTYLLYVNLHVDQFEIELWIVSVVSNDNLLFHVRCLGTIEQCTKHILKMCKDLALDCDSSVLLGDFLFTSRGRETPGVTLRILGLARAAASNSKGDHEHVNFEYVFSFCHDMSLVAWKHARGSFRHWWFLF